MKKNNGRNLKQDIAIAELKKDINWIKDKTNVIENQVFNHLPSQIANIKDKLTLYLIIGIVSVLILQILLKFF